MIAISDETTLPLGVDKVGFLLDRLGKDSGLSRYSNRMSSTVGRGRVAGAPGENRCPTIAAAAFIGVRSSQGHPHGQGLSGRCRRSSGACATEWHSDDVSGGTLRSTGPRGSWCRQGGRRRKRARPVVQPGPPLRHRVAASAGPAGGVSGERPAPARMAPRAPGRVAIIHAVSPMDNKQHGLGCLVILIVAPILVVVVLLLAQTAIPDMVQMAIIVLVLVVVMIGLGACRRC